MAEDKLYNAVYDEFERVRKEHSELKGSFLAVTDQHEEMLTALKRVQQEHNAMSRDLAEIKDLLLKLLER